MTSKTNLNTLASRVEDASDKLITLAERLERSAIADAENANFSDLHAKRAYYKFGVAASLRARSAMRDEK